VNNEEEPAPSAPGSEIGNDDAASDAEQASSAHKRRKTGLTKCDDEYTVSKQREALSAKANTGKFTGLRVETPARRNSAKTAKHGGKDFVYGVLFVTLLAFGAKTPVNCTAKCFCSCTSDCEYFFDLTSAKGKDGSKTSIYRKFGCHWYLLQHDSTWKKIFHSNVFFEKWNDTEEPKKKSEKRDLAKDKWYNQMGQVGTSWSRGTSGTRRMGSSDLSGTSGTRRKGSSDLRGTSGTRTRGLSTWTIHSFQMGLQGREMVKVGYSAQSCEGTLVV